jgi:hypothetical protein
MDGITEDYVNIIISQQKVIKEAVKILNCPDTFSIGGAAKSALEVLQTIKCDSIPPEDDTPYDSDLGREDDIPYDSDIG